MLIISGSLKKYLKSEKAPSILQKHNNIYQLVGENFESITLSEDKFVFVFFTRRNCGLCNEVILDFKQSSKKTLTDWLRTFQSLLILHLPK
jgi:thioredoxin-related protein